MAHSFPTLTSTEFSDITPDIWFVRREEIHSRIAPYLGTPTNLDADWRVSSISTVEEVSHPDGVLSKIAYEVEPGEIVHAWLLVPHHVKHSTPALLCLHGTSEGAKDTTLWSYSPKKSNRDWATQLCREGFVTFSPDCVSAGERKSKDKEPYFTTDFYNRHPHWSEMGKIAWDVSRALDAMALIPAIDSKRIGIVGHSLGGYGSIQSAAFDERIKAVVSSCGLTVWENNEKRFKWARRQDYFRHFPMLYEPFSRNEIPFELYELAALIAPRAFLNISGMQDAMYGLEDNAYLPEAGRRLSELWKQVGNPEGFANFLFGGGHEVPLYSCMLIAGWFRRWL